MGFFIDKYEKIREELSLKNVTLVAVSKTHEAADIMKAYQAGQRDFAENYVQELIDKQEVLPKDIRWHFIGHLQSNKVKYIASFIHLIHGVDSEKLLLEIDKQGKKITRIIPCLLQIHISAEETKFGLDEAELQSLITKISSGKILLENAQIKGLMGMASFTEDNNLIILEFNKLKKMYDTYKAPLSVFHYPPPEQGSAGQTLSILSMGMSADYSFAIEAGSNLVRIGSLLFGSRHNKK